MERKKTMTVRRSFSNAKQPTGSFADGMSLGILLMLAIPVMILAIAAFVSMFK